MYSAVTGLPLHLSLAYSALESHGDTCDECVSFYVGGTYRATPKRVTPVPLALRFRTGTTLTLVFSRSSGCEHQ